MTPFKLVSSAEFQRLSFQERLAYLSDAMAQQRRSNRGRQDYSWDKLFNEPHTQQENLPGENIRRGAVKSDDIGS